MPVYEYFCRTCNTKHEKMRPMRDADAPLACPNCRTENSVRTLSMFVTVSAGGSVTRDASAALSAPKAGHGGGCCGGACGCHH